MSFPRPGGPVRDRRSAAADDGSPSRVVEKTEAEYTKVQTDLVLMHRSGEVHHAWLADATRWMRKPDTFGGIEEALRDCAALHRKALWRDIDAYAEIWLEKDALAGVIYPITNTYYVPLFGYQSLGTLSDAHSVAQRCDQARR